eukprot:4295177-Pleurochrysis_carterae.AAC.1
MHCTAGTPVGSPAASRPIAAQTSSSAEARNAVSESAAASADVASAGDVIKHAGNVVGDGDGDTKDVDAAASQR